MSDFLTKRRLLLAKEESSYGQDPTPDVSSNAIDAKNIKVAYPGEILERDNVRPHLSPLPPVLGKYYMRVTFEVEVKGSGTKGVAPRLGDLLEACGFTETASVGSSVTYLPNSVSDKSVTIYVYDIGASGAGNSILHKLTGCRGNVSFEGEAGQITKFLFDFQGLYNAKADVTTPGTPNYGDSTLPPTLKSASFTLNGVSTLVVQKISIDMGNQLSQSDSVNASSSIGSIERVGRRPSGSFNPEAVKVATYDFTGDWNGATTRALSMQIGAVAGNICTITAPALSVDQVEDGDKNGIKTDEIPFKLSTSAPTTGNNEIQIKFT